jgi:hypothetical protein
MVHRTYAGHRGGTPADPRSAPLDRITESQRPSVARSEPAFLKTTPAACCCTTGLPRRVLEDASCQGERHD